MKLLFIEMKTVGLKQVLEGEIRSLRFLSDTQEEMVNREMCRLEDQERGNQAGEMYLGVVSISVIFKGLKLNEITKVLEKKKI